MEHTRKTVSVGIHRHSFSMNRVTDLVFLVLSLIPQASPSMLSLQCRFSQDLDVVIVEKVALCV